MAITVGEHYHFLFGTEAQYKALQTAGSISANDLYFITDTKQLYVGEDLYTGQVKFVDSFPASPSQGIIYVNGAYKNDDTEIGRLVHYFGCVRAADMYNEILKNTMNTPMCVELE